jgi:hypothetical protein
VNVLHFLYGGHLRDCIRNIFKYHLYPNITYFLPENFKFKMSVHIYRISCTWNVDLCQEFKMLCQWKVPQHCKIQFVCKIISIIFLLQGYCCQDLTSLYQSTQCMTNSSSLLNDDQWRYSPDRALASLYGFHDSFIVRCGVISSMIDLF